MRFNREYKYFNTRPDTTIEDIKVQYRNLAIHNHPDRGGDTAVMAAINAEFDALCKLYNGVHRASDGSTYTNPDKPDIVGPEFRALVDALLRKCDDSVRIEIVGTFVWVSGNTYGFRDVFKDLGMRYAPKKGMWYKCPFGYVRRHGEATDMDAIRDTYGVVFDSNGKQTSNRDAIASV